MKKTDVLIIGGSAGGITAGISARRNYPSKKIVLIREEKQVLVPCGIPYIFGTLGAAEKNLIPDAVLSNNKIDLVIDKATDVDKDKKTVKTSSGEEIEYEKIVLATGSLPIVPPIPGIDLGNVFIAKKDVEYLNQVLKALDSAKDVVIIGGGFIGLEFADEIRKKGLNVSIIEMLSHCLQLAYDPEFCLIAEEKLKERGIKVFTNKRAEAILGDKKVESVKLDSGEELKADVVILGIGVAPDTELAQKAGLKIGETKGILVDGHMRTSSEDIFAVGDCAEKTSFFTKRPSAIRLASIAGVEARIAGANLFELRQENEGSVGVFSTIIGDSAFGVAGLTENMAKEAGIDFIKGEFKTLDKHPGTIPNTVEQKVKLLFAKSGEIIGGGVSGGSTTAEVTNIIAVMIQKKMKVGEVALFQMATHPLLTPSPIPYPIVNAAEIAMRNF